MIASMVEEQIDTLNTHITWKEIAQRLNLDKSTLSKFKNNGTELNFFSLYELSKLLYPKKYKKVMRIWCSTFKKPANLKHAFEFLSANRFVSELDTIVNSTLKITRSAIIKELCLVYKIILLNHKGMFEENYINTANELSLKHPEANALLAISKIYYYNKKGKISKVFSFLKEAEQHNDKVEDCFLKEMYQNRINEMKSVALLFGCGNTKESRVYAEKTIQNNIYCDTFKADSYYRIGMSYLFESPDLCLANLNKAKINYEKDGLSLISEETEESTITFVKIYWGLTKGLKTNDPSAKAFLEARLGNKDKALEIIRTLNQESPFTKYYEGIAKEDYHILLESLIMFVNNGNYFYAKLPYELLKTYQPLKRAAQLIMKTEE